MFATTIDVANVYVVSIEKGGASSKDGWDIGMKQEAEWTWNVKSYFSLGIRMREKIMMEKINDRNRSKRAECDGTHRG